MPKTAQELYQEKLQFLLKAEEELSASVLTHQQQLYELILSEYMPLFETENGIILSTPTNDALINQIDNIFDKLNDALNKDVLGPMATNIIQSVNLSGEYYVAIGFQKTVIANLLKDKISVEAKLGITPKGFLKKDGYLYKLGQTAEVRQKLKSYVISNLTGDTPFLQFQLGLRNLVIGNKRVKGLATTGYLQQYFDQYAIDSFAQVDAVANKQIANELQLEYFVYEGSLIKSSRPFCVKRAGKAFKVSDTKNWKNDPDLIDKKSKDAYKPLIERGRYRCRHSIRYITKALYDEWPNK